MGREARGRMTVDGASVEVSLHLDGRALQVRGGLRRDIARADVVAASADGTTLTVRAVAGDDLVVDLDIPADRWAVAILATPPTLAQKLGLTGDTVAMLVGDPPPEVAAAVGRTTVDASEAAVVVATVRTEVDLVALPGLLAERSVVAPVWVIHGKGRAEAPGETAVRRRMRAAGYRDTKVSAVSDGWSATRYTS